MICELNGSMCWWDSLLGFFIFVCAYAAFVYHSLFTHACNLSNRWMIIWLLLVLFLDASIWWKKLKKKDLLSFKKKRSAAVQSLLSLFFFGGGGREYSRRSPRITTIYMLTWHVIVFCRCFDGNIIAIPVEIETPDHHYYHVCAMLPCYWCCKFKFKLIPCNLVFHSPCLSAGILHNEGSRVFWRTDMGRWCFLQLCLLILHYTLAAFN